MGRRVRSLGRPIRYAGSSSYTGYMGSTLVEHHITSREPLTMEEQLPHLTRLNGTITCAHTTKEKLPMKGHMDFFWEGHYTKDHTHKSYKQNYRPWRLARRGYKFYRWLHSLRSAY